MVSGLPSVLFKYAPSALAFPKPSKFRMPKVIGLRFILHRWLSECQSCSAQSRLHIETTRSRSIQKAIESIRFQQL